jgi:hypothetical protein
LVGLGLKVREVLEGAQGPEVVADIVDYALFYFALFLGAIEVAGPGDNSQRAEEVQEGLVKADEGSDSLGYGGQHIIGDQFFGCALEEAEGMEKAAVEGFLSLGVGEFQVEEAAVAFEDGQAVELPFGFPIGQGSKMAPVYLALLPGKGFKAEEGLFLLEGSSNAVEIVLEDGDSPLKALGSDPLKDHGRRGCGIEVQEPLDFFPEGVQFAGPLYGDFFGVGVLEIFSDGFGAKMEGGGNLFLWPTLVAKAVYLKDRASIEHGYLPGNE